MCLVYSAFFPGGGLLDVVITDGSGDASVGFTSQGNRVVNIFKAALFTLNLFEQLIYSALTKLLPKRYSNNHAKILITAPEMIIPNRYRIDLSIKHHDCTYNSTNHHCYWGKGNTHNFMPPLQRTIYWDHLSWKLDYLSRIFCCRYQENLAVFISWCGSNFNDLYSQPKLLILNRVLFGLNQ